MAVIRKCNICQGEIGASQAYAQDYSWSLDIFKPRDLHLDCLVNDKLEREKALAKLPEKIQEIQPPLGYHVYWEDEYICPAGLSMEQRINEMYAGTPDINELYV